MTTICHVVQCNGCGRLVNLMKEEVTFYDADTDEQLCKECYEER